MKRTIMWAAAAIFLLTTAAATRAFSQDRFTVTFPFQAGSIKFSKGDYTLLPKKDDTQITIRQESSGKEFQIPFTKRLPQPSPAVSEPQLVFDVVGNFAPSYTDYVTDYVLSEVWLPGAEGFLVHTTKGAHKTQVVKGQKAK